MKVYAVLMTSAFLTAGAHMAHADCAADLAALDTGSDAGTAAPAPAPASSNQVAKDGSTAPLQSPGTTSSSQEASEVPSGDGAATAETGAENKITKDGSTAPLESAGEGTAVATSGQDVAAQQAGEPTAAEQAADDSAQGPAPATRAGAIEKARTALAAGDEAACMDAVEQARNL